MNRNLAYFSSTSPSSGWDWFDTLLVVFFVCLIVGPIVVRRMRTIRGPGETGTAQVLSLGSSAPRS